MVAAFVGSWAPVAHGEEAHGEETRDEARQSEARQSEARGDALAEVVRFPACGELPFVRAEFERLFAIELGEMESPPQLIERAVSLELDECAATVDEVRVTIDLRFSRREPTRLVTAVRFADVPSESRARTLAVALAELVRLAQRAAEPREVTRPPDSAKNRPETSVEAPRVALAPERAEAAARLERDAFSIGVVAASSAWSGELSPFWSGGVDARLRFGEWRARLGGDVGRAEGSVALGHVGVTAASLAGGLDYVLGDAPLVAIGPTLRGTWLHAAGVSKRGLEEAAVDQGALTLSARASVEARLGGPWSLLVAAEAGVYLRSVEFTGGGAPLVGFSGAVGRLELGFVYAFTTTRAAER